MSTSCCLPSNENATEWGQKSADAVKKQLWDLSNKIDHTLQPVFKRRKICEDLKMCEPKPPIISQQCVVYNCKCDLETIGDLTNNFSVLKKCNGRLDCLIYEMLFITKKGHAYVQNHSFKFVTFLHAYFTFYRLARPTLSCQILFSFHLKMMTCSHRNVV